MIWKCVMFFDGQSQGWSEELFHRDSQSSANLVAPAFEVQILKRCAFLGTPFRVMAYRISAYATNAGAIPVNRAHFFLRKDFPGGAGYNVGPAEPGNVGISAVMSDIANATSTRIVCGAPPDQTVTDGGRIDWAAGGVGGLFDAYLAGLGATTGPSPDWGWGAVGLPVAISLKDAAINTDTQGRLTIAPLVIPGSIVAGEYYPARISGVNKGKSAANGQLLIGANEGRTGLVSKETIAVIPVPGTGGQIKVYTQLRTYTQYGTGLKQGYSTKHRRGRPFGLSRGRQKARPRG